MFHSNVGDDNDDV